MPRKKCNSRKYLLFPQVLRMLIRCSRLLQAERTPTDIETPLPGKTNSMMLTRTMDRSFAKIADRIATNAARFGEILSDCFFTIISYPNFILSQ